MKWDDAHENEQTVISDIGRWCGMDVQTVLVCAVICVSIVWLRKIQ